jgi:hypothetical protein
MPRMVSLYLIIAARQREEHGPTQVDGAPRASSVLICRDSGTDMVRAVVVRSGSEMAQNDGHTLARIAH